MHHTSSIDPSTDKLPEPRASEARKLTFDCEAERLLSTSCACRWGMWRRHACAFLSVLLPIITGAGALPPLLLAQEAASQAPPAVPSFVFDGLLVVVLFGLAIFTICRAGRRN